MGGSICVCNKENQNIPTSHTNFPLVDENFKNNKKYLYRTKNSNDIYLKKEIFISKHNCNNNKENKISIAIKNFDNKIKEFAIYISEKKFIEFDDNPTIKKLEEKLDKNFFAIKDNSSNNNLNKTFSRPPLLFINDKSIYKGSWNFQGKKESFGILVDSKGNKYIGEWKDDQFNGKGRLLSINGDFYEGDFVLGKMEGNGIFHSTKYGYNYTGEFKNNKFHGKGKLIYDDNTTYEGSFSEGYMNGEGNLLFKNGAYYKGNFEKNKFNGKGKFYFENGRKYDGDWKNNDMDGFGIFTWDEKTKYKGEYIKNAKEGNGVYTFGKNSYDGHWLNNMPNGKGTLINEKCRIEGQFRFGKLVEIIGNKEGNEDVILNFSSIKSNEESGLFGSSRNSLPELNSTLIKDRKEMYKKFKTNKTHKKSKDKEHRKKGKSKSKSNKKKKEKNK